jgi:murein DD-endopeptidase MepM/ murein hydrolase activator NlpD
MVVEGVIGSRTVALVPGPAGHTALLGIDLDERAGPQPWRIAVRRPGAEPVVAGGVLDILPREFSVQHLTLPPGMVDLDPETERRALAEAATLRSIYESVAPGRLWSGSFARPVPGSEPGTGFGSRRVINGKPRAPHTGVDYSAPRGTPVLAANAGRVALVAEFFFPGRLVIVDHGLALYTLYFHLDRALVTEGQHVTRGQQIGTVGATGRATGPHLHFGVHAGGARLDPTSLLGLPLGD